MSKSAQKQSARDKESDSATGGAGIHGVDLNNLKQELFLKIVVLGDLGVGKTSLVRTYTESGVVGGPGSAGSGSEGGGGGGYKVSFDAGYHLKRLEVWGPIPKEKIGPLKCPLKSPLTKTHQTYY